MSSALSAGVTGLQAHQKMLDIAGNNLANVNTTAFKSTRITFSELLGETIKKGSQPTGVTGGTNPQQLGGGVGVSGITPNMTQGSIVTTGNPLDLALEGQGYFVLNSGSQSVYTRAGAFAVDASSNMVDPATGYIVQRIGSTGEADGFQIPGNSNIKIPYDVAMPASATSSVRLAGNLSSDAALDTAQANVLKSNTTFRTTAGEAATGSTTLAGLASGTFTGATITFSGYKPDGTALGSSPTTDLTMAVTSTTTLNDVLARLNTATSEVQTVTIDGNAVPDGGTYTLTYGGQTTAAIDWDATPAEIKTALEALPNVNADDITVSGAMGDGVTFTFADTLGDTGLITMNSASLTDGGVAVTNSIAETTKGSSSILGDGERASLDGGRLTITDTQSGYSQSDMAMAFANSGTANIEMPGYFEISTVGGNELKNVNITIYDSLGGTHVLSGALVRTNTDNTWDMVMTSITGDVSNIALDNRRIKGINFNSGDGSLLGAGSGSSQFTVAFTHDASNPQTINVALGTVGRLDGLTQFAGSSTAVAREQDGYASGRLSTVSVNNEGILIGDFSNGIKKNIAAVQVALFQNASGLEALGNGYYTPSANSGGAVATGALNSGAGSIHGGSLEKSNADVASEFVNLIQAQNGYQANARTIKVANDILTELTNLIR
jgi:flagellar hook protein FlgE